MHNIDQTNNVVHMATATTNARPWWERDGLEAIRIDPNDSPEQWRKAALDWDNDKAKVSFQGKQVDPKTGEIRIITSTLDDRFVIYRNDTLAPLTTSASTKYHIHSIGQLCEAMAKVCDHGNYRMSTIGSLRGGKEIWFMATTDDDVNIAGEAFNRNVILGTSYDQSKKSFAVCSDVAVVCANTLNYALNNADDVFRVSHLQAYNPAKVVGDLDKVKQNQLVMETTIELLAETKVEASATADYFKAVADLLPVSKKYEKEPEAFRQQIIKQIADSYTNAPGARLPSRVGTLHGATQAVVHFVDYKMLTTDKARKVKTGKGENDYVMTDSRSNRFNRAFFGDGQKLKSKALDLALARVA